MLTKRDNMSLGCAGLAVAGTPAGGAFKITNIVNYLIAGLMYQKAATDNIAQQTLVQVPAVALPSLAANQVGVYFVLIDVSGGVWLAPATRTPANPQLPNSYVAVSQTGAGYQAGAFEWPSETAGYAILGAIKVSTNGSGAFVPGTTSLAAANMTVTYYNAGPDLGVPIPF